MRPHYQNKFACKHWSGWLRVAHSQGQMTIPVQNAAWGTCKECDTRKRRHLRKRFKAAWLHNEWGPPVMYTFTFRTKDKYETWEMFRHRTGASTEAPAQRLAWPRKGLHLPTLTYARAHLSNKQWQQYLTAFFQRLGLYYRRKCGEDLAYLAVPEYTKQGTPHIHMLVPCLLYTSPSPRDRTRSRMPSSA